MLALADIRALRPIERAAPDRPGCVLGIVAAVVICLPWWLGVIVIAREILRALK